MHAMNQQIKKEENMLKCKCGRGCKEHMSKVSIYEYDIKTREYILCPSCFIFSNFISVIQVLVDDKQKFKQLVKEMKKEVKKIWGVDLKIDISIKK